MIDWITTPKWALQEALENIFITQNRFPLVEDYEVIINISANRIKGTDVGDRAFSTLPLEQKQWIEMVDKYLKNTLTTTDFDKEFCPIVWIKLGLPILMIYPDYYNSVCADILKIKNCGKYHLKDFYVVRGVGANDVSNVNVAQLLESLKLMPLDDFLLQPLPKVVSHLSAWRLITRISASSKFIDAGVGLSPKKTKRERLGIKYYDLTIKEIERLILERVSIKLSREKVANGNKYTFNGSRVDLLNIFRKKNKEMFPKRWDYKAVDVLSDIVCCRYKK